MLSWAYSSVEIEYKYDGSNKTPFLKHLLNIMNSAQRFCIGISSCAIEKIQIYNICLSFKA